MIADPATYLAGPPHGEFARLRRERPVAWIDEVPLARHTAQTSVVHRGDGFWAVTRHAAVSAASRQPEVFSSAEGGPFLNEPTSRTDLERVRRLLVGMDPPRHPKVKKVVTAVFTPAVVRGMRAAVREHAEAIVARARAATGFDVVADLAAELPLLVLADLLGLPREDRGLLLRWSNNLVGFDDPQFGGGDIEVFKRTLVEAFGYAIEAGKARRRSPGDDLVSRLVTAEVDGQRLTETEFCHLWLLLVVAGNETTRHLLSGGLELLVDRPERAAWLAVEPERVPTAVEEMLRWLTPIMQFRRTAIQDTELDGQSIRAGEKVVLYYISANRDEAVFSSPNGFDPSRAPNPHLAFGLGPHFCLGAHLARLEAVTMIDVLRPHLAGLRRVGPTVRLASNFMNGIKSLPLAFAC